MISSHTGIAVVESRWYPDSNLSVAPLFNLLGEIWNGNPNAYHYEMVGCEAAFKECLPRIGKMKNIKFVYIATHGNENGLALHNGDKITRSEIRNILHRIKKTRSSYINGLHFGSCLFGTKSIAQYINEKENNVSWIAGYKESVEWISSSALDLQFFNLLLEDDDGTPLQRITRVAAELRRKMGGACRELGFGIYVRQRGPQGGIKDLLDQ